MYKAIIFDWGGVIEVLDLKGFYEESSKKFNVALKTFKKAEMAGRVRMDIGEIGGEEYIDGISKACNKIISQKDFYELFFKHVTFNEKLFDLIKKLKQTYKIFMVSNNNPPFHQHMKRDTEYEKMFDKVILSYEVKIRKPDKEIFMKTLAGTELSPNECIFIDDKAMHADAARKIGIEGIVYNNFEDLLEKLKKLKII